MVKVRVGFFLEALRRILRTQIGWHCFLVGKGRDAESKVAIFMIRQGIFSSDGAHHMRDRHGIEYPANLPYRLNTEDCRS